MKLIIKPMFFVFSLMLVLTSCNTEDLFVEDITEVVSPTDPDATTPEDADAVNPNASLPCDFNLNNLQPNQTVIINCVMDLGGATINVPSSVTILYEGGDIVNGTLNFNTNTTISGELLNSSLTLTGSSPIMKDPVFEFNPKRWGIVEGKTTSAIALKNRNTLESVMQQVKNLGINTFKIDKMDAYFEISLVTSTTSNQNFYSSVEAINVPGDFNLIMTDNTHLRVQPNKNLRYALLSVREVDNVTITGGNLYGDRDEHDYSNGGTHEWGHVVELIAATNTIVRNVKMKNGSGDGLKIHSLNFTFQSDYKPSHAILVQNCTFDSNRRNNISVTDGFDITLENNLILNAGIDTGKSLGASPKYGIDVEAVRASDGNGGYIFYEKAYDIFIRNNTESGSVNGFAIVAVGDDVIIENNNSEGGIAIGTASGVKIKDNTIKANINNLTGAGINTGHPNSKTTFNNTISGNTIIGYNIGIAAYQRDTEIFDNTIIDFGVGIQPKGVKNMNIYRNKFNSSKDTSIAIFGNITAMDNVKIYENEVINVGREAIKMIMVNNDLESINNKVIINNNRFLAGTITFGNSKGIDYNNNISNKGLYLTSSADLNILGNTIYSENQHAIRIVSGSKNITITQNDITVTGNKECITQSLDVLNINILSNSCN